MLQGWGLREAAAGGVAWEAAADEDAWADAAEDDVA